MIAQKQADAIREAEIEAEVKEFDKKWQGKNVHISLKNGILNVDGVWNETPKHLEIDYINGTEVLTQFPNKLLTPQVIESTFSTKGYDRDDWADLEFEFYSGQAQKTSVVACQTKISNFTRAVNALIDILSSGGNATSVAHARSDVLYYMDQLIACMLK